MKEEKVSPQSTEINTTPLSRREVGLLAEWERARISSVTIDDVRRLVGAPAKDVVKALARKGVLQRVGRGVYLVRPFRSLLRPTASSPVVAIAALLRERSYYLGGLWAFTHHRLTTQQYVSVLDAFVTRLRPPRDIGGARVIFHALPQRLMEYGLTTFISEGIAVRASDIERTLLDVLDHPAIVGGVGRALALVQDGYPRSNPRRLVDYAVRGSRSSTCQRLGVLLERRNAPRRLLARLEVKIAGTRSLLSMLPDARRVGQVNRRWRVVENDR